MRRYKSACQLQRFLSGHEQMASHFMHCRYNGDAKQKRELRTQAFVAWNAVTCAQMGTVYSWTFINATKIRPRTDNLTIPLRFTVQRCGSVG